MNPARSTAVLDVKENVHPETRADGLVTATKHETSRVLAPIDPNIDPMLAGSSSANVPGVACGPPSLSGPQVGGKRKFEDLRDDLEAASKKTYLDQVEIKDEAISSEEESEAGEATPERSPTPERACLARECPVWIIIQSEDDRSKYSSGHNDDVKIHGAYANRTDANKAAREIWDERFSDYNDHDSDDWASDSACEEDTPALLRGSWGEKSYYIQQEDATIRISVRRMKLQ